MPAKPHARHIQSSTSQPSPQAVPDQDFNPAEMLLRALADDPTIGPWATWAECLLTGGVVPRSVGDGR